MSRCPDCGLEAFHWSGCPNDTEQENPMIHHEWPSTIHARLGTRLGDLDPETIGGMNEWVHPLGPTAFLLWRYLLDQARTTVGQPDPRTPVPKARIASWLGISGALGKIDHSLDRLVSLDIIRRIERRGRPGEVTVTVSPGMSRFAERQLSA